MVCKGVIVGNVNTCKANFIYTVDSLTRTVKFSDCSYGSPNEWTWDFGDNTTSYVQNPSHVYNKDSMYLVHLIIQNDITNCSAFIDMLVNVSSIQSLNCAFGYNANTSRYRNNNYPVDFDAAVFGYPSKYVWDFGDGTKDSLTTTPTHNYTSVGNYNVCLFVEDLTINESDLYCKQVDVSEITNINNYLQSDIINLYPNPASDNLIIESSSISENQTISVYNLQGQLLLKQPMLQTKIKIDISALPVGMYYVELKKEKETMMGKFVKE
jgi:PKD repeat protein